MTILLVCAAYAAEAVVPASCRKQSCLCAQDVLRKLSYTSSAEISPMAAMFGGVVGQEVMKAASGKFHPLFQFFYFDSIESLPDDDLTPEQVAPQVQ